MLHSEFEPSPNDNNGDLLEIAFLFDGIDYCNGGTKEEFERAKKILIDQHRKVMPKFTREKMCILSQHYSLINAISHGFHNAFLKDNLALALESLNSLYVFGNIDYMDFFGKKAFPVSLEAHRVFAERITEFFDEDPFLATDKLDMLGKIDHYRDQLEPEKELNMLRRMIHTTVLAGTLGENAKKQFDPFAIAAIEK